MGFLVKVPRSWSAGPKRLCVLAQLASSFSRLNTFNASRKIPPFNQTRVGSCFNDKEIKELANLIRSHYSSCIWKRGDILLVDNKKVMHAGMPGTGPRLIRAMICNPLQMNYSSVESSIIDCSERSGNTIGFFMSSGALDD